MNKKNILLMVPMLHQGGFERVCVQTARLLQDDYNVHILIFSSKNINYDVSGLDIVDINVPSRKGMVNKVLNVLKRVRLTKKVKKNLKIDIAYSFGSSANYVNVLSRGKEKVITGLRCQTDMENVREVNLFSKKADLVLSCSKEIVRQLERDFDYNDSECVYNPLDIEAIRNKGEEPVSDYPFNEENVRVISCMGRNDYIKGIWHLVKAFSLVAKNHPEARLLVLGAGNWDSYVKMSEELGISDKVSFPGVRKNPFSYVSRTDIYVCSSNHEGFPNALLEALALGKPVISADCKTGPREILLSEAEYSKLIEDIPNGDSIKETRQGEYGILIPDLGENVDMNCGNITDEERMLADAIIRMLEDDDLRNKYSVKALERASHYTPEKYKENICKVFKELD